MSTKGTCGTSIAFCLLLGMLALVASNATCGIEIGGEEFCALCPDPIAPNLVVSGDLTCSCPLPSGVAGKCTWTTPNGTTITEDIVNAAKAVGEAGKNAGQKVADVATNLADDVKNLFG